MTMRPEFPIILACGLFLGIVSWAFADIIPLGESQIVQDSLLRIVN